MGGLKTQEEADDSVLVGSQKKIMSQLKLISQQEIASHLGEGQLFVLFRHSVERTKPTRIRERSLLRLLLNVRSAEVPSYEPTE